ncbi:hypothetical protein GCM10011366_30830 [Ornithinimicrobium tianjinense]|uniref:Transcriptional regulator, AbiEi antitoxin, Type IV TA system n=2 Tax=Ornithinimicrobium tianjinense TaxID=1195761 RepID=A0A917FAL3_9MICO|nr:hypothetical protein GCM10011366_30830 [Ornithinimicrobium tianjinense]
MDNLGLGRLSPGTLTPMSGEIEVLLTARGGVGSARALMAAGVSRRIIEAAVRRRLVTRIRQDALVLTALREAATPWERRVLDARAVGHSLARPDSHHALSHTSSLAVLGLPYYGRDSLVHLVRTDGQRGRRDATVWVHRPVDPSWVVEEEELRLVEPALAALQVAATHGAEAGIVALDGVLRQAEEADLAATQEHNGPALDNRHAPALDNRHGTALDNRHAPALDNRHAPALDNRHGPARDSRHGPARERVVELTERALAEGFGSATHTVREVVAAADGRSESTGESRTRWLVRALGWACTPQVELRDEHGQFVARVDLLLDDWRVVIEFDGAVKYTDPAVVFAEKDRERRIRDLGYEVVRLRWADLDRPAYVRQLILKAIARAGASAA